MQSGAAGGKATQPTRSFASPPNGWIFAGPQTNVTSADFGRIRLRQVNTPRQIQFGLRFVY